MKSLFAVLLSAGTLVACAQTPSKPNKDVALATGTTKAKAPSEAVATFGEGCFWHAELVFQSLKGVRDAVSGYSGGSYKNPTYEIVGSGNSGHAEAVQVFYDPKVVSYETLVKAFFASQDPTQLNRQGNDVGTQYRSVAFYNNESEKQILLAEIKRLTDAKKFSGKIVTEVVPFTKFYPAELYHQEFIKNHPENSYGQAVCLPEFLEFKKEFKGNFKQ